MIEEKDIPTHKQRLPTVDKVKQQKQREAKVKDLKKDLAFVFGTVEGRRILRHIKEESGFGRTMVGGNPTIGMDVTQGMLYNEGRQSLYLELRTWIPSSILKLVEYENLEEEIQ